MASGKGIGDLGRESGTSAATISRIENGLRQPSAEVLVRIAEVLKVNLEDLLDSRDAIRVAGALVTKAVLRQGT